MGWRTRFTRIGNSFGVRIPRPLIEASGLGEQLELEVERDRIVIRRPSQSREGWSGAFTRMAARGEDEIVASRTWG